MPVDQLRHNPDVTAALELIGARWSGSILYALQAGPLRFNRLLEAIPGISDRVLTERLRSLGAAGLVYRDVQSNGFERIRVTYGLTPKGRSLAIPIFDALTERLATEKILEVGF